MAFPPQFASQRTGQIGLTSSAFGPERTISVSVPANHTYRRVYVAWVVLSSIAKSDVVGRLEFWLRGRLACKMEWQVMPRRYGSFDETAGRTSGGPVPPFYVVNVPMDDPASSDYAAGFPGYPVAESRANELIWVSILTPNPEAGRFRCFELHASPLEIPVECDEIRLTMQFGAGPSVDGDASCFETCLAVHSSQIPF